MSFMLKKLISVIPAIVSLSLAGLMAVVVNGCSTGAVNTMGYKPDSKIGYVVGKESVVEKVWEWKYFRDIEREIDKYTIETLNGEREEIALERTKSLSVGECVSVLYENDVAVGLEQDDGCVFKEVQLNRVKVSPVIWDYDVVAETMWGSNTGEHGTLKGMGEGAAEGAKLLLEGAGGEGSGYAFLMLPITMTAGAVTGGVKGYSSTISEEKLDGISHHLSEVVSRTVTGATLQQSVLSRLQALGLDGVSGEKRKLKSAFKRSSYEIEVVRENGSMLDVGLIYLSLVSGGGSDPEAKLRMQARAQMFLVKNDELHSDIVFPKYESPVRPLSMWQEEHYLHEELVKGIDNLSMQILQKFVPH